MPINSAERRFSHGVRPALRGLHRTLGLCLGAPLVLLGITGTINVFGDALDRLLNPSLLVARDHSAPHPIDEMVAVARERVAPGAVALFLVYPADPDDVARMVFRTSTTGDRPRLTEVLVDPGSCRVLGTRDFRSHFTAIVFDLHKYLLLGPVGTWITFAIGVFMIGQIAAGIATWWPNKAGWRLAFSLGARRPMRYRNYQLHRIPGVYVALLLLVSALSGVALARPEIAYRSADLLSPTVNYFHLHPLSKRPATWAPTITPSAAAMAGQQAFPAARLRVLAFPEDPASTFQVSLIQPSERGRVDGFTLAYVDRYSGKVLLQADSNNFSPGNRVLEWLNWLHTGDAFGLPGRVLVALLGIAPAYLFVTGFRLWRQRSQRKKV